MSISNKEDIKKCIEQHCFTFTDPSNHDKPPENIKNIIEQWITLKWKNMPIKNQRSILIKQLIQSNKKTQNINIQELTDEKIKNLLIDFFVERTVNNICHIVESNKIDNFARFTVEGWNLLLDGKVIIKWSLNGDCGIFPSYQPYPTNVQDGNMHTRIDNDISDNILTKDAQKSTTFKQRIKNYCKSILIAINAILHDQAIGVTFHTSKESENNPPNNKNNKIEAVSFLYTDKKNNICKLYKVSFTEENAINIQFIPFDRNKKIKSLVTDEEKQHFKELFFSYSKDKPPFMENIEHEFNDEQRNFFDKIKDALGVEQIQNKHTKNDVNNNSSNTKDDKKDKIFLNNKNNEENKRINDTGNQIGNNTQYVYDKTIIENKNDKTGNNNSPPCTLCCLDLSCLDCCHIFSGKQQ